MIDQIAKSKNSMPTINALPALPEKPLTPVGMPANPTSEKLMSPVKDQPKNVFSFAPIPDSFLAKALRRGTKIF